MTYKEFIDNIISTRGRHGCGEEYHEKHHIKPKCLGGEDKEENYVELYAREHFIAHRLLALENPDNISLQYAWWATAVAKNDNTRERYKCTDEEMEEVKSAFTKAQSIAFSGENNPNFGHFWTEEKKRELSKKMRGENSYNYGRHFSEETRRKMSEAVLGEKNHNYGKHLTEETKEKLSQALSGENNPRYGTHLSEESKKKIGDGNRGKKRSEEVRRRMSETRGGKNHPRHRPVVCVESGEVFWGAKEVENKLGINSRGVGKCCKGERKTAGGFHWRYATKEEIEEMNKGDEQ